MSRPTPRCDLPALAHHLTCARYGYALDVPAGWYSEPVQGTPRVSGDCLAHPSDTGDTSASFTQDKSRSGFAEVVGAKKEKPRGQIAALLKLVPIPAAHVRYASVARHGATFTVVENTYSGKTSNGTPYKIYLLMGSARHRGVPLMFFGVVTVLKNPDAATQIAALKGAFASFHFI